MSLDRRPGISGFPKKLDVEFAVDGDMNKKWKNAGEKYRTPAQRISVQEALLSQTRQEDSADRLPQSRS